MKKVTIAICFLLSTIAFAGLWQSATTLTVNDDYEQQYSEKMFRFYGLAGEKYEISVIPDYGVDVRIDLYNQEGEGIGFADSSFESEAESVSLKPNYDGIFVIKVSNFHTSLNFRYLIKVVRDKFCFSRTYLGHTNPNSVVFTDRGDSAICDEHGNFKLIGCSYTEIYEIETDELATSEEMPEANCFLQTIR